MKNKAILLVVKTAKDNRPYFIILKVGRERETIERPFIPQHMRRICMKQGRKVCHMVS